MAFWPTIGGSVCVLQPGHYSTVYMMSAGLYFSEILQRARVLIIHPCISVQWTKHCWALVSTTRYKPEMLIRERHGDLHSVWSGPRCSAYTVFSYRPEGEAAKSLYHINKIIDRFPQDRVMEKTDLERSKRRIRLSCTQNVLVCYEYIPQRRRRD